MPFSPFSQWVGIAKEVTRGTALAPSIWIPVESPAYTPNLNQIEDKAMRGSMVDVNDLIAGIRDDELDFTSYMYTDTIGSCFRALLGSPDNGDVSTPGAADTLAALCVAGAPTISTTATHPPGTVLRLDTVVSGLNELVTVSSVSGAGPYTLTLSAPTQFAHANGASITPGVAPFSHTFSLLNNSTATGNQPPSYSVTYFNGNNARQIPAGQMDSMAFTFNPTGIINYKTKWFGYPAAVLGSPPTPAPSTVDAIPAYNCVVTVGGSATGQLASGSLDIKRATKPVNTLGNTPSAQAPYRVWAGPCSTGGKLSLVMEDDVWLLDYLNSSKPSLDMVWTAPNADTVEFHMNSAMFKTAKPVGGKEVMEIDADFVARPNTTDATAGGSSPIKITLKNSVGTSY